MSLNIARRGKLYVVTESPYANTSVTFASADAVRHQTLGFTYDPYGRVTSKEKKSSPGAVARFDRRQVAGFDLSSALIRPSGVVNTLPEADEIYAAAFGQKVNTVLATTVASSGAIGGCTLTSATGLAVNGALQITVAGIIYVRMITAVNTGTGVVTWWPNLPGVPSNGATVKSCLVYSLTTDLATSLAALHVLPGFVRALLGISIDKFGMKFNANEEAEFNASGPAATEVAVSSIPSTPAAFTTVGGNPPSGLTGDLWIGNTQYLFTDFTADITNNTKLRNMEYGNAGLATEAFRSGRREVALSLKAYVETQATLHDLAAAGTETRLLKQTGRTSGNIIAVACPRAEFKVPTTDDPDSEAMWDFKAAALETADGQNDEIFLILG